MALTKEDLQAIASLIDSKLDEKLSPIKGQLEELKEITEETREAANAALLWIDTYWRNDFDKPFPPKEKDIV